MLHMRGRTAIQLHYHNYRRYVLDDPSSQAKSMMP